MTSHPEVTSQLHDVTQRWDHVCNASDDRNQLLLKVRDANITCVSFLEISSQNIALKVHAVNYEVNPLILLHCNEVGT